MYKKNRRILTTIKINESVEGETLEQKIERIVNNKEPITDGAPPIYTERKDGVIPAYDVRTDRWEIALEAMDIIDANNKAKREARHYGEKKENGKAESIQGQANQTEGGQTTE